MKETNTEATGARAILAARAKQYLEDHYTDKFSLESISGDLFIDKIYLSKCFKEITGTTLLRYHNELRVTEAARLLKETDLPVALIGERVGYMTSSHFARIFKEFFHCSPSQYRERGA